MVTSNISTKPGGPPHIKSPSPTSWPSTSRERRSLTIVRERALAGIAKARHRGDLRAVLRGGRPLAALLPHWLSLGERGNETYVPRALRPTGR